MKKILLFFSLLCSVYFVRSQPCGAITLTSGPNALGTGGSIDTYHQSPLSYNSDLNTVLWIHRSSPYWMFAGHNSGCIQATWIDLATGVKDSSIIYRDSSGGTVTNQGRYPSGAFYNPAGNPSISNSYVVGSGPALVGSNSGFNGLWYSTRKLTGTSADQLMPGLDLNYTQSPSPLFGTTKFLNYDMQQVGTKVLVAGEAKDTSTSTNGSFNAIHGGIIAKCDFSGANPVWTYDSIIPSFYFSSAGYANDGCGGRIAFDPSGTIGYWVAQGRLANNYNNSADSMLAPVVYKTTNGGASWSPVLQGFDWSGAHPELKKNIGYLYNSSGMKHFKVNPKHGSDLTVDSLGVLHFVTTLTNVYQDGAQKDSMGFSYTYDYDYINHHPVIWDLMTDGNTWNTLLVDSVRTSYVGADPTVDTTSAYGSWTLSGSFLAYGARIQVSRSITGGKIFYSWSDSDPMITGTQYNTQPDIYVKSYDVTNQKVTPTINLTSNVTNASGTCFFHFMADVSYFDNSYGTWVSPVVYTTGNVMVSPGVYDGTSSVNYNYFNCGVPAASYTNAAVVNQSTNPCTPSVSFIMHQDSVNPQPGIWEASAYYSSQVNSAVWYWGDGTSTSGLTPSHTYASPGQYNICVTVFSICGDSASACQNDSIYKSNNGTVSVTVLNENHVDIKKNADQTQAILIYPNPTEGTINLHISNSVAEKSTVYITNVLGEVVYSSEQRLTGDVLNKQINLSGLDNGSYLVRIVMGAQTYNQKLVISR